MRNVKDVPVKLEARLNQPIRTNRASNSYFRVSAIYVNKIKRALQHV